MLSEGPLFSLFEHYCRFGGDGDSGSGLTSRNFVKLLRDKGAIDKTITTTVADLSFTKAAAGGKRLSYGQFRYALELCAQEKGISMAAFAEKLGSGAGAGPVSTPSSGAAPSYWTPGTENLQDDKGVQYHGVTKPQYNRFYDDKSTWNALHKNGGPAAVPKGSGYTNVPAHIAGATPAGYFAGGAQRHPSLGNLLGAPQQRRLSLGASAASGAAPERRPSVGATTGLAGAPQRRLSVGPLPGPASTLQREPSASALPQRRSSQGAQPSFSGATKPNYNRFYDDKSTWTRMHKNGGPDHGPKRGSMTAHWSGALRN